MKTKGTLPSRKALRVLDKMLRMSQEKPKLLVYMKLLKDKSISRKTFLKALMFAFDFIHESEQSVEFNQLKEYAGLELGVNFKDMEFNGPYGMATLFVPQNCPCKCDIGKEVDIKEDVKIDNNEDVYICPNCGQFDCTCEDEEYYEEEPVKTCRNCDPNECTCDKAEEVDKEGMPIKKPYDNVGEMPEEYYKSPTTRKEEDDQALEEAEKDEPWMDEEEPEERPQPKKSRRFK